MPCRRCAPITAACPEPEPIAAPRPSPLPRSLSPLAPHPSPLAPRPSPLPPRDQVLHHVVPHHAMPRALQVAAAKVVTGAPTARAAKVNSMAKVRL